jgi:ABC-type transport system substrate-binding protein
MRSIRRRIDRAPAIAAVIALAAVACSTPLAAPIPTAHPGDETPRRGGVLRLASFADIRALDPAVASDALSSAAVESIFAGLVDFDASANVVPDLASRYEIADDGLTPLKIKHTW